MPKWKICSMPVKRYKLTYLTPAEQDIREIVKLHITQVGVQSARGRDYPKFCVNLLGGVE